MIGIEACFSRFRFFLARREAAGEEKTSVSSVPVLAINRRSTDTGSVEAGKLELLILVASIADRSEGRILER